MLKDANKRRILRKYTKVIVAGAENLWLYSQERAIQISQL